MTGYDTPRRMAAQKMKFSIKDFVSFLRIWSHLMKKSLMENLIFCAAAGMIIVIRTLTGKGKKWSEKQRKYMNVIYFRYKRHVTCV